eukprot:TRINITY_DN32357_c0_g2_i1.p1 TRINITY_DN32357_c0_g2~~TRINITY_DN32357_c0_g2_i1.p1  ORF type:complete len:893 (+),score=257.11 TRINITY_DN32357_c0_g2_i1:121-2799(+)
METNEQNEQANEESGSDDIESVFEDEEEQDLSKLDYLQGILLVFLDGKIGQILMAIFTFYALFGDDMRLYFFYEGSDSIFEVITTITFFAFVIELILNITCKTFFGVPNAPGASVFERIFKTRGYLFSFFFWLDLIAAASLVMDMPWIWGEIVGNSEYSSSDLTAARAGRLSRVGSKAGRILRMVRLVRLIKLYVVFQRCRNPKEDPSSYSEEQSRVGAKLSETTTRKVIVMVLCMMVAIPLFTAVEEYTGETSAVDFLAKINGDRYDGWTTGALEFISGFKTWGDGSRRLIYLSISPVPLPPELTSIPTDEDAAPAQGILLNDSSKAKTLRTGIYGLELIKVIAFGDNDSKVEAWFDHEENIEEEAFFSMCLTVFVTILLLIWTMQFSSNAQKWVLKPIEHMVAVVNQMAKDPLQEFSSRDNTGQYETRILENTIKKMGGLIRVGFGAAGAEIIQRNMQFGSSFDPMIPGQRVNAVFAFCDIRNFTDTTEVLKEEVLLFVNRIAKVVHDTVVSWDGAPNKNVGDAFLVTWKIPTSEESRNHLLGVGNEEGVKSPKKKLQSRAHRRSQVLNTPPLTPATPNTGAPRRRFSAMDGGRAYSRRKSTQPLSPTNQQDELRNLPNVTQIAQKALIATIKCFFELERADLLSRQQLDRLEKRMPNYRVRLGFGLHAGWAIEGAIGSVHKVDASYLSPNINITEAMEGATKAYGVPILMTAQFTDLLGDARAYCRKIDRVLLPDGVTVTDLYTFDIWDCHQSKRLSLMQFVDLYDLEDFWHRQEPDNPEERFISVTGGAPIREHPVKKGRVYQGFFKKDSDMVAAQTHISRQFQEQFRQGVNAYLVGNWQRAQEILRLCVNLTPHLGGDGPSKAILDFMEKNSFLPPSNWRGYRKLES